MYCGHSTLASAHAPLPHALPALHYVLSPQRTHKACSTGLHVTGSRFPLCTETVGAKPKGGHIALPPGGVCVGRRGSGVTGPSAVSKNISCC